MPEGPELLVSRDQLRETLITPRKFKEDDTQPLNVASGFFCPLRRDSSRVIDNYFGGRYHNKAPQGFEELHRQMLKDGWPRVVNVDVKGKFMWWEFSFGKLTEPTWWMHCTYGMSGQWHRTRQDDKHTTAAFKFSRVSGDWAIDDCLSFIDPRHFGTLKFVNDRNVHETKLASLGPDMLSDPPDVIEFGMRLNRKRQRSIVEALMDQGSVSGVGNYIKAEALYRAKISPHRHVASLLTDDLTLLRQSIIDVMKESYASKGATIKTYVTVDGQAGGAQFAFRVYGQKADPDGRPVVKEETLDGRTTHWVPGVQL